MQLGGKAGFQMSNDFMLNHLDFIVEATIKLGIDNSHSALEDVF